MQFRPNRAAMTFRDVVPDAGMLAAGVLLAPWIVPGLDPLTVVVTVVGATGLITLGAAGWRGEPPAGTWAEDRPWSWVAMLLFVRAFALGIVARGTELFGRVEFAVAAWATATVVILLLFAPASQVEASPRGRRIAALCGLASLVGLCFFALEHGRSPIFLTVLSPLILGLMLVAVPFRSRGPALKT